MGRPAARFEGNAPLVRFDQKRHRYITKPVASKNLDARTIAINHKSLFSIAQRRGRAVASHDEFLFFHVIFDRDSADIQSEFLRLARLEFDAHLDQLSPDGAEWIFIARSQRHRIKAMRLGAQRLEFFDGHERQARTVGGLRQFELERHGHALVEGHTFGLGLPPANE